MKTFIIVLAIVAMASIVAYATADLATLTAQEVWLLEGDRALLTYTDQPPRYSHWQFAQCTVPGASSWGCEPGSEQARRMAGWYLNQVEQPWRGGR